VKRGVVKPCGRVKPVKREKRKNPRKSGRKKSKNSGRKNLRGERSGILGTEQRNAPLREQW